MDMFSRRRFLQSTAGALGAIGLSQLGLSRQANRYGRTLAQSTSRKVALLVGIDAYENGSNRLNGAVNDVELQKRLLINRFGFEPANILTLQDQQATRQNILGAFDDHLYQPAKAGDVVVFHFSGHGEEVRSSRRLPELVGRANSDECFNIAGEGSNCFNTAIAPIDHNAPSADTAQDIMGHTLLLLRAALAQKTENITFVLDCCYAGGGKRGNAIMRSLNPPTLAELNGEILVSRPEISDDEWTTQRQWLDRLGWSVEDFAQAIESPSGPGFFIGSAKSGQLAADYSFNGFSAGAFTFLLTQHLWQATGPLSNTMQSVANSTARLNDHTQVPEYDPKPGTTRSLEQTPIYHVEPVYQPAEALILEPTESTNVSAAPKDENSLRLWLGGLDPQRLEAFDQGAVFSIIDRQSGETLSEVQQIDGSRQGLITQARLVNNTRGAVPAELGGQLLRERTRGIPERVVLKIALDDTLTAAEQQAAKSAFSDSPDLEVDAARPGRVAHVLLGRYTEEVDAYLTSNQSASVERPALDSIGIFSPSQVPLLTHSFGAAGESIEDAISGLRLQFTSLHIGRMLALMVNGRTSQLNVGVEVEHLDDRSATATRGGGENAILIPEQLETGVQRVQEGEQIKLTIKNNQPEDLHFGIVVIDSAGEVNVLYPPRATDDPMLDVVRRNSAKMIPPFKGAAPFGIAELLVLASPQSLVSPLNRLRNSAPPLSNLRRRGENRGGEERDVEAVSAADVMTDLFGAMETRSGGADGDVIEGTRLLDVEDVAALSLLFEIVPKPV
ncbi:MAG: caspase family protein [Cyanobacteria bacterium J06648_11]